MSDFESVWVFDHEIESVEGVPSLPSRQREALGREYETQVLYFKAAIYETIAYSMEKQFFHRSLNFGENLSWISIEQGSSEVQLWFQDIVLPRVVWGLIKGILEHDVVKESLIDTELLKIEMDEDVPTAVCTCEGIHPASEDHEETESWELIKTLPLPSDRNPSYFD